MFENVFPLLFWIVVAQDMCWWLCRICDGGSGGNKIKANSAQLGGAGTWADPGNILILLSYKNCHQWLKLMQKLVFLNLN